MNVLHIIYSVLDILHIVLVLQQRCRLSWIPRRAQRMARDGHSKPLMVMLAKAIG